MAGPYATEAELTEFLGTAYSLPADVDRVLARASEAVDDWTLGSAEYVFTDPDGVYAGGFYQKGHPGVGSPQPAAMAGVVSKRTVAHAALLEALSAATCAQVEFWQEVGEEYDVGSLGQGASVQAGRVQINKLPMDLGRRARRILRRAGFSREVVTR